MNSRGLVIVAVIAIAILLVGSTAFSHNVEAKKRQPSEIKVYVSNVGEIKHKLLLRVCLADDDDCFGKEKTIDLQKHSGDKKATVATYHLTFSIADNSINSNGTVSFARTSDNGVYVNNCNFMDLVHYFSIVTSIGILTFINWPCSSLL